MEALELHFDEEDELDDDDVSDDEPLLDADLDAEDSPAPPAAAMKYTTRETTSTTNAAVCCKLTRICRLPELVTDIQRVVYIMKQVQLEGSHFANLHVLRCLAAGLDAPNVDQTFYYHCCSAVLANQTPQSETFRNTHPMFDATWAEYRGGREIEPSYQDVSLLAGTRMLNETARMMAINATNMVKLHFRRRLHQFIRFRYAPPGKIQRTYKATKRLVDACYRVRTEPVLDAEGRSTGQVRRLWNEWDDTTDPDEIQLREWLEIVPWQFNVEKNTGHFLKRLHDMLKWMEAFAASHQKQKGTELYTLLPLTRSYQASYVKVNASILFELLNRLRSQHPSVERFINDELGFATTNSATSTLLPFSAKSFQQNRPMVMRKVFDVVQFETNTRKFAREDDSAKVPCEISTNGYAASICLTHPITTIKVTEKHPRGATAKAEKLPSELEKPDSFAKELAKLGNDYSPDVLIGIDPGIRSLATAVSVGRLRRRRTAACRQRQLETGRQHRAQRIGHRRKCSHRPRRKKREKRGRLQKTRRARNARRKERQHGKRVTQISTCEYYHLARFKASNFWFDRLKKREHAYAGVVDDMPSFKTASLDLYCGRLRYFWTHLGFLLEFTIQRHNFCKSRFTRDCGNKRAMAILAKRLIPQASKRVCVGLGDWSRQDGVRGHPHAPVKSFALELQKRATVILIDEFRTSADCSGCHKRLKQARLLTKVKRKEDEKDIRATLFPTRKEATEIKAMSNMSSETLAKQKLVLKCTRNVLRCSTSGCKATLWDRDVNAATNILELLRSGFANKHGASRLRAFKRGQPLQ